MISMSHFQMRRDIRTNLFWNLPRKTSIQIHLKNFQEFVSVFLISKHFARKKLPRSQFMNKDLSNAIMTRARLRNRLFKKSNRGKLKTLNAAEKLLFISPNKNEKKNLQKMWMKRMALTTKLFGRLSHFFFHIKQEIVDSVKNKIGKYKEHSSVIPIRLKSLKI